MPGLVARPPPNDRASAVSLGLIYGLASALAWGLADYLAPASSHRIGVFRLLVLSQATSFFAITPFVFLDGATGFTGIGGDTWALALATGLLATLAYWFLQMAFATGVQALVAPICASYGAVTVLLTLAAGAALDAVTLVGLVAVTVGVFIGARVPVSDTAPMARGFAGLPRGVIFALAFALTSGTYFWVFGAVLAPSMGALETVWITRAVAVTLLLALAAPLRQSLALPAARDMVRPVIIGLFDVAGLLALTLGSRGDDVAIVTVLSSMFAVVTVFLAWSIRRERLSGAQWAGVAILLAGVVLLH